MRRKGIPRREERNVHTKPIGHYSGIDEKDNDWKLKLSDVFGIDGQAEGIVE